MKIIRPASPEKTNPNEANSPSAIRRRGPAGRRPFRDLRGDTQHAIRETNPIKPILVPAKPALGGAKPDPPACRGGLSVFRRLPPAKIPIPQIGAEMLVAAKLRRRGPGKGARLLVNSP